MVKIYTCLLAVLTVLAVHAEPAWKTDFEAAKEQAKKENKPILLDFTGSDWCPPCKALKKNVFDKPEFEKFAKEKLVLVELDFPRTKELPEEVKKQNDKLQKQFSIEGFPTIIILSSDGKELGRMSGFGGDTASSYVKKLEQIIAKQKS